MSGDAGASVRCPVCEVSLDVGTPASGELLHCHACRAGFHIQLARAEDGTTSWHTRVTAAAGDAAPGNALAQRFEVLGTLGRGGQGAVLRVRPRGARSEFALKYLDRASASSSGLQSESEIAGLLRHPNIVALMAIGRDADRAYAVYEIVEGSTLRSLLDQGPVPLAEAVDLALQVLAGLAHSHERRVVHRDIKPANVLLSPAGLAKITDFGVGRLLTAGAGKDGEGDFVGTPAYAPPEQIEGRAATRASDVYSFGVLFYELLCGRRPFQAPSIEIVVHHQLNSDPPPIARWKPDVPPALEELVLSCLAKDPARRPADARVALEKLSAIAGALELPVPAVAWERGAESAGTGGEWLALARLAVGALVLAIPIVVHGVEQGAPALAEQPLAAPAIALALGLAGAAVVNISGRRAPWDLALGSDGLVLIFRAIGLVVAVFVVAATSLAGPDRTTAVVWLRVAAELAVLGLVIGPVLAAWMEDALAPPPFMPSPRGEAQLELRGPDAMTVSLDGSPAVRVPATLPVAPGPHALSVAHAGRRRAFTVRVERAAPLELPFESSADGPIASWARPAPAVETRSAAILALRAPPVALLMASLFLGGVAAIPARRATQVVMREPRPSPPAPSPEAPASVTSPPELVVATPRPRVPAPSVRAPTERERRAAELAELGVKHADEASWDEAVAAYRKSLELADTPMTRRALAESLGMIGRGGEGRRLLEGTGMPRPEAERWEAEADRKYQVTLSLRHARKYASSGYPADAAVAYVQAMRLQQEHWAIIDAELVRVLEGAGWHDAVRTKPTLPVYMAAERWSAWLAGVKARRR
jgi:hypothetical protein